MWDLSGRNHEITLLKLRHIRLREKYGEGEIPHEAKTGSGPILLTCSFPYVRDWINEHPFRNEPNSRLICNLMTGAPIKPEALWTMMKQLKERISRLRASGCITDVNEQQKLDYLLVTKKWNPYCIRHSAITSDSDYLPDYALKKKARWSMNSKQPSRYIKTRMGDELKQKILVHFGIINEDKSEFYSWKQNATDLYTKSLESELQSNNHFRNYLLTNNSTESKLSSKLLSDSFTNEIEAFKKLKASGLFTIVP
jgi:integrase/recombinase XerD